MELEHAWDENEVPSDVPVERLSSEITTRQIDLEPKAAASDHARLVLTHGCPLEHATLSYCWGYPVERHWLTTIENVEARLQGIDVALLPATVRDSFTIAKKLGIRYIWVDALCILQNDKLDWAKESAKMAGIYRGSLVTIAASHASSVSGGCLNESSSSHWNRFTDLVGIDATLSDGRQSSVYVYEEQRPNLFDEQVISSALAQRAWTYQEQVVSRRTIYYTASQLIWDCEHCRLTEDNFPFEESRPLYPISDLEYALTGEALFELWYLGPSRSSPAVASHMALISWSLSARWRWQHILTSTLSPAPDFGRTVS